MIQKLRTLKNHAGFMRYFKNSAWLLGERVLRMVVGLFVGIWVARYLEPDQFGLLSYAQSFAGLFTVMANLGLDSVIVRELVKDDSSRDELIGTAFWLKAMGALAAILALAIAVNFTTNDTYTNTLIFIIASATVFQSFNVIDFYYQAKVLSRYVVFANLIALLLSSLVKIGLILSNAPLIAFAWVIVFDSAVLAGGFVYVYLYNQLPLTAWKFKLATAKKLLQDSWPLLLSGMIVTIYMKIDQVMIQAMLGNEAVGQYAAAVRISEAWYFIPVVVASSLFPAILSAKSKSEALYYARLQKLYDLMAWMAIAIALPMTLLSDRLVYLLYGGQYDQAGSVLAIHIWAGFFVFLGVASGKWLIAEHLQMLDFWRTLAGMIANVVLNFLMIPSYGIQGAAIATLLSQCMAALLFDIWNKKTRVVFFMKVNTLNLVRLVR